MSRTLTKFFRRSAQEHILFVHAYVLHAVIFAACRTLPFGSVVWLLGRMYPASRGGDLHAPPALITWAVRSAAAHSPCSTCLTRALTAQCLLRRHGCVSSLHIGVSRASAAFGAHAWLERATTDGSAVIVGATAERYDVIWAE